MGAQPIFREAYARAREAQMEKWADDIVDISDDARNDFMERVGKDNKAERVVDQEAIQRSRLRVDTRKWLMSKLAAKRYGDRLTVEVSGTVEVAALSDAELERRIRARLKALGIEAPTGPLLLGWARPADEEPPHDADEDVDEPDGG